MTRTWGEGSRGGGRSGGRTGAGGKTLAGGRGGRSGPNPGRFPLNQKDDSALGTNPKDFYSKLHEPCPLHPAPNGQSSHKKVECKVWERISMEGRYGPK